MRNPRMLIGTDRLELYEFQAMRRETILGQNRTWLKIAVMLTCAHMVAVGVPTLFSRFFGDEVSMFEKRLGSEDQSEFGLKM